MPSAARKLRIAFLTPEFVMDSDSIGGLAVFVMRMTKALDALGHEIEIFALARRLEGVTSFNGIRVEHVLDAPGRWLSILSRLTPARRRGMVRWLARLLRGSKLLANAFHRRHREKPFDIVHSSDYGFTGLFVSAFPNLTHVTRCSWAADLFNGLDWRWGIWEKAAASLERRGIRRADLAYAPSNFIANHLRNRYGLKVATIRPPLPQITNDTATLPEGLPTKFLIYFGLITPRKGSDILAEALTFAWKEDLDLTMVWAGTEMIAGEFERYRRLWGERGGQVRWLGAVARPVLHQVVKQAVASIVPSRVDNLPNSALESLSLGVPVIGSDGASLDEIIESRCGELFPIGDSRALAESMLRAWRGTASWNAEGFRPPAIFEQMEPNVAAEALLAFVARAIMPAR